MSGAWKTAAKFAAVYAILAGSYILWSDRLVASFGVDASLVERFQTFKGLSFVGVTALLLFFAIRRYAESLVSIQRELRLTECEIVDHLGKAAEFRDDETGYHVYRVQEYCAAIARKLGWSPDQVELLYRASAMHDIGKIGVPDHVLLKPGALSPEERNLIQEHTVIGAKILSRGVSQLAEMARCIALHHHERWDGTGYPSGKKGAEIPIEGRICAVADVFDALTSRRRYKEAWTFDDAVAEISAQSGKQFDPSVVEAFLDAKTEIRAIYDQLVAEIEDEEEPIRLKRAA